MYVITFILGMSSNKGPEPQKNHLNFESIAEIRSWSERHNYVLGTPALHTAIYAIEHKDGSPLSPEELHALQPFNSDCLFERRQEEAFRKLPGRQSRDNSHLISGLHSGAANAILIQHHKEKDCT